MANLTDGYKAAIKREMVDAIRDAFIADAGDNDATQGLTISSEFPTTEVSYPRIMVSLREREIKSAGVGHLEMGQNTDGQDIMTRHMRFDADVAFTIYALSSVDRDILSGILVNIISFPDGSDGSVAFHNEIYDSDWIDMQIQNDWIVPSGDNTEDVPWGDPLRKVYSASYSIRVIGEFWTQAGSMELVMLREVNVYPYKPGQTVPTGSTNPLDADVEWQS
jgi:hypothetical protein